MEEKKLDIKSIIGFVLIFGILIYMFYQNQPTPEELEAQKAEQARVEAEAKAAEEAAAAVQWLAERGIMAPPSTDGDAAAEAADDEAAADPELPMQAAAPPGFEWGETF